jgi:uncharacterized DUF497 family protein
VAGDILDERCFPPDGIVQNPWCDDAIVDVTHGYAYNTYMSATWDPRKAQANFRKHGVRFSDAEAVLLDPNAITRDDPTAEGERRFVSLGSTSWGGSLWWCTHTARRTCG